MKPRVSLPPGRNLEQLRNHYLVEKHIAERLRGSRLEERKQIYATMYGEVFRKVPDHPRLTRRDSDSLTARANNVKLSLVGRFLSKSSVFVEFAAGDCRFAGGLAKRVARVYAVDISDQRNPNDDFPENFQLIVYDGYSLNEIEKDSVDVVFSDQLIEHLHPQDTALHLSLVHRILKTGGRYVFRTPHAFTGPHDVSRYFSDEPEGFHLKEWTYSEIRTVFENLGYRRFLSRWYAKGINFRVPHSCFYACERILALLPTGRCRRFVARFLVPSLYAVAIK